MFSLPDYPYLSSYIDWAQSNFSKIIARIYNSDFCQESITLSLGDTVSVTFNEQYKENLVQNYQCIITDPMTAYALAEAFEMAGDHLSDVEDDDDDDDGDPDYDDPDFQSFPLLEVLEKGDANV